MSSLPEDRIIPVVLTHAQHAELLTLLDLVPTDASDRAGQRAVELREVIAGQRVDEPTYEYVLAGPWGTLREGDGSLEATITGCRDARRQHWEGGHGRDDRYDSIRVLRSSTVYVYDADDEDLGRFTGPDQVIPVDDEPLTDEEQAESERRIEREKDTHDAIYARLRERMGLRPGGNADTVSGANPN